jgi:hypothetical protein
MKRLHALALIALLAASVALAQKRALTHADYDGWKSLGAVALSNDGKWLAFSVNPQEGDNTFEIKATDGSKSYKFDRGTNIRFTDDSKFVVATIIPKRADTLKATREKVKPEDRPKNSLFILNLATGETTTIEKVASYNLARKGSTHILYPPEPPKPEPAKPEEKPKEGEPPKQEEPKKKKGHSDGTLQVLRNLATGEETKFENVGTYVWNEEGTVLYFVRTPKPVTGHGVFAYEVATKKERAII